MSTRALELRALPLTEGAVWWGAGMAANRRYIKKGLFAKRIGPRGTSRIIGKMVRIGMMRSWTRTWLMRTAPWFDYTGTAQVRATSHP
jgi:hypothetical protein